MKVATCRGCGRQLKGEPYYTGKLAYIPETGEIAKINYYGGFVCSYRCDFNSSLELEQSMPGHGASQKRLGCFSSKHLKRNWPNY